MCIYTLKTGNVHLLKKNVLRKWSKCSVSVSDKFASDYVSMCEKEKVLEGKKQAKLSSMICHTHQLRLRVRFSANLTESRWYRKFIMIIFCQLLPKKIRKTGFETVCESK